MRIVLTSTSPGLEAAIDPRFGRADYFLVVDIDTLEWEVHTNPGANAAGGAGIKAAQCIFKFNVAAAISGEFGPNAFDALQAAGIAMYRYGDCRTASQAIERFKVGQLEKIGAPTRQGHHGRG